MRWLKICITAFILSVILLAVTLFYPLPYISPRFALLLTLSCAGFALLILYAKLID